MSEGWIGTVASLALAAALVVPAPARAAEEETRDIMHGIFAAFATLVSLADDPEAFAAPDAREDVLAALRTLARRTDALEGHAGALNASHRAARRALSDDVAGAIDAYVTGRTEGARFLVGQMAEDCFACHSKLPSRHGFALGEELLESDAVAGLPIERRAMVAVAARQFEPALALFEESFRDPRRSAVQIALSGAFESYLKVALRVLDDRERAMTALRTFRQRPDVPLYLAAELDSWVETLERAPRISISGDPIEPGRYWIREGQLRTAYPGDRRGLVHFVLASRELHRYAATRPDDRRALAEVFYLLGVCEIHISPSLWVSEVEEFLETSIRTAPETIHARRAYATLEAVWVEGYTGSSGTHVPLEIRRRLESLRTLIDAAAPAAGEGGEAG